MKYIIKIITLYLMSISLTANAISMAIKNGRTLYDPAKAWRVIYFLPVRI